MSAKGVFLRAPFNYDVMKASDDAGLACDPKDCVTQQQFTEECDINTIVNRFGLTGELPFNERPPISGDFSGVVDFKTAMDAVRAAEEGFYALPAKVRDRFANDPARMLSFLDDASNREEAVKLGLVNAPAEVDRKGEVVAPVAGGTPAA